jgi:hypothetical protein
LEACSRTTPSVFTPELKNTNAEDVIEVQSGLLTLQNLFNYRAAYNLIEDVGFGVVLGHLDNIAK